MGEKVDGARLVLAPIQLGKGCLRCARRGAAVGRGRGAVWDIAGGALGGWVGVYLAEDAVGGFVLLGVVCWLWRGGTAGDDELGVRGRREGGCGGDGLIGGGGR